MSCHFTPIVPIVATLLILVSHSEANAQTASPSLAGTSWQLVRIQSMNDKVAMPSDRSKTR